MKTSKKLEEDKKFMRMALRLAEKGRGCVSPNPIVGAVVVKAGKVVGRGYHQEYGGAHAEVHALEQAGKRAKNATLYVTLEPCCSYGKTPPCLNEILETGIKRVVIGTRDPNLRHAGKGLDILRKRKIQVTEAVEEEKAQELIRYFSHWIKKKIPYVIVKQAMSLDGKIATYKGDSKWISSPKSREWVHQLRSQVDAILVGKTTAQKDDPLLTCRLPQWRGEQPIRFVLSRDGKVSPNLKLFTKNQSELTFLVASTKMNAKLKDKWERSGVPLILVPEKRGKIDFDKFLKAIGEMGVMSLLVEGGGETVASFFEAKYVNQLFLFVAPKIVGGKEAPTPVGGLGLAKMSQAIKPKMVETKQIDKDLLIEATF